MLDFKDYRRNLRAYFFVGLVLVSFSCCADAQESSDQGQVAATFFFPKSDSDWKRVTAAEVSWNEAALNEMCDMQENRNHLL